MATQTKVVYYIGDENTPYLVKVIFYTATNMLFYCPAFDLECSIILSRDVFGMKRLVRESFEKVAFHSVEF
jgi:hypothetical protein